MVAVFTNELRNGICRAPMTALGLSRRGRPATGLAMAASPESDRLPTNRDVSLRANSRCRHLSRWPGLRELGRQIELEQGPVFAV